MWIPRRNFELLIIRVDSLECKMEEMGRLLGLPGFERPNIYRKKTELDSIEVAARLSERVATMLKEISSGEKNL